jgi:hypothetical protein
MADESKVLGIRLDAEERKRFDEFVNEEGKNNKDFLNTLLNLYELNKGKVKNINLIGDIDELEKYTNKIHQAFISVIDKLESQKSNISEDSQKDLLIYKDKVNSLEEEYGALKLLNSARQKELISVNSDNVTLKEQHAQLQENLQDKLTIIKEYQGKNDTLSGIIEEYKGFKAENENIKKLLSASQTSVIDLKGSIKEKDFSINELTRSQEKLIQEYQKTISELDSKHNAEVEKSAKDNLKDLESLKKESQLNVKLAVAEIKEELNNKLNQEQQKHNEDIQEYQGKYKLLLEQLELERASHTTKKNTIK